MAQPPLAADMAAGGRLHRARASATAYWYISAEGLAGDPAPNLLWIWIAVTGVAAVILVVGWRGSTWWRRGVSVVAVPLCVLCAGLALNQWVGYFPTVQAAWNQLTAGPLPDQTDRPRSRRCSAAPGPAKGIVVPVTIPDRFRVQAPRRTGVPPAGLVRHQPAAAVAGGDDDRRRVQHPGRLAARRQRDPDH